MRLLSSSQIIKSRNKQAICEVSGKIHGVSQQIPGISQSLLSGPDKNSFKVGSAEKEK
jgi:hypothetical protein